MAFWKRDEGNIFNPIILSELPMYEMVDLIHDKHKYNVEYDVGLYFLFYVHIHDR